MTPMTQSPFLYKVIGGEMRLRLMASFYQSVDSMRNKAGCPLSI